MTQSLTNVESTPPCLGQGSDSCVRNAIDWIQMSARQIVNENLKTQIWEPWTDAGAIESSMKNSSRAIRVRGRYRCVASFNSK